MCGGVSAQERFRNQKDDQIDRELARLANLRAGTTYSWPIGSTLEKHSFGGHCRSETIDRTWAAQIARHVKINVSTFSERDTVGGTGQLREFSMPAGKAIAGVILRNGELRIVTKQAEGAVASVHHREPQLVDL